MDTRIVDVDLEKALGERYLSYALSTIISRSLPDVRDGLKPVHRRLIYAMQQLKLHPNTPFKKSARVVGDVIGKFHPHGDASIYDALVRLAQDFSVRYPLIEGQGNFGNIDGDNAAAMRYTEARLTRVAHIMLEGIDENAIDFRLTFDDDSQEPIVLPSSFPNLLANGSQGIAVGMATAIPPHNCDEICDALYVLIDNPQCRIEDILACLPGPDFPTGGVIVESPESIATTYATGRGSFRLRAQWHMDTRVKGGAYQIIITEIPYQVQKSKLIERVADLLSAKKLPFLEDIIDESADDLRIVLIPKNRNVVPEVLMESLFRTTDLEVRIPLNMNVLDHGKIPRVMPLKEVLQAFLNHQQEVLVRRSQYRLDAITHRLEILHGYHIAYLNLDEIIAIIREEEDPKNVMMERFQLTDTQAEAILNMRLRALRRLEEIAIQKEIADLGHEQNTLEKLIQTPSQQWKYIKANLKQLKKEFGKHTPLGARRTTLATAPVDIVIPIESMIEREDVTVVCSAKGWIRTIKGHQVNAEDLKYKEGDEGKYILHTQNTEKLLIFATNGKFYTLDVNKLAGGRGHGEPIRTLIDLDNQQEIIALHVTQDEQKFLLAASDGRGFMIDQKDTIAQTKTGKQVMTLPEGILAVVCLTLPLESIVDHLILVGSNRKILCFPIAEIPTLTRGRGVMLQKYRQGTLSDLRFIKLEDGLKWERGSRTYHEKDLWPWQGRRGTLGRLAPLNFPRNNKFTS